MVLLDKEYGLHRIHPEDIEQETVPISNSSSNTLKRSFDFHNCYILWFEMYSKNYGTRKGINTAHIQENLHSQFVID